MSRSASVVPRAGSGSRRERRGGNRSARRWRARHGRRLRLPSGRWRFGRSSPMRSCTDRLLSSKKRSTSSIDATVARQLLDAAGSEDRSRPNCLPAQPPARAPTNRRPPPLVPPSPRPGRQRGPRHFPYRLSSRPLRRREADGERRAAGDDCQVPAEPQREQEAGRRQPCCRPRSKCRLTEGVPRRRPPPGRDRRGPIASRSAATASA